MDPVDDQLREIGAKGAPRGRHREQHGRDEHRPPAAQPVAQHARTEHPGDRAGQRAPHIPPLLQAVQPEAGRHQLDGAGNHGRVVPEQESAHGRRDRKKKHVGWYCSKIHTKHDTTYDEITLQGVADTVEAVLRQVVGKEQA